MNQKMKRRNLTLRRFNEYTKPIQKINGRDFSIYRTDNDDIIIKFDARERGGWLRIDNSHTARILIKRLKQFLDMGG